jgi:hypothetical protein
MTLPTRWAAAIRNRRDEWIRAGVFAGLLKIAREAYDRIVGPLPDGITVHLDVGADSGQPPVGATSGALHAAADALRRSGQAQAGTGWD